MTAMTIDRRPSIGRLVEDLKDAQQDHEFYPTTNEIITALARNIGLCERDDRNRRERYHSFESVLDIGAGNGKVLTALKEKCGFTELFAIEKASILCRQMPEEILIVGTEFNEQSLMSKPVDVVYCNPPYSHFEDWSTRIIRESAAKRIYLCIPQRWTGSTPIADAVKFRDATTSVIGSFDFEDAEDRAARAKVQLLCVRLPDSADKDDAFDRWFNQQFAEVIGKFDHNGNPRCGKCGHEFEPDDDMARKKGEDACYYCPDCQSTSDGKGGRNRFDSLVIGPNYPESLVQLYNAEMAGIQRNFQALGQLDVELMREFEILPARIMACLKARMKGLKNDYWMELFSHLDTITSRLTSKSRQELLNVLHKHVQVDFTVSNILEVVIWVIKNANTYLESQLVLLYEQMAEKANVLNYKSNKRVFTDNDWRYLRGWERSGTAPSNFKLDFRIVLACLGGCRPHYGTVELAESAAQFMGDLMTIANNLGFRTENFQRHDFSHGKRRDWKPGEKREFHCIHKKKRELLFDVRAFQNGNCHFRLNQDLMLALNVEYGRLKGWLRNPQQAAQELDNPKAVEYFNGNLQLGMGDVLMLAAPAPDGGPDAVSEPECLSGDAPIIPDLPPVAAVAATQLPAWRRRTAQAQTPVLI